MSSDVQSNASVDDDEQRIEALAEAHLERLRSGQAPDAAALVAAHPNIADALRRRLALVERLFHSVEPQPGRERARRLNCPHCGNRIQLVEPCAPEIVCQSCGSSIRLEPRSTATFHQLGMPVAIGRFQIMALLGRGAFGEVYKAHDHKLDRTVAVKIPRAESFTTPEEQQRFLREARSAAGLRHASIVQVHEVARDGEMPYIVSDFIEGLTLADLLSGDRPGFPESAEMIAELAEALDYAHRHKVVHRDIKPSNILLARGRRAGSPADAGERLVPFLTDFGLARRDEGEITLTLDGQVLGTPAYMAPEQAIGAHRLVDGRSDIYSLGVVLYELLSGELPFRGNQRMLLHQVVHDEPRPPRSLNDRIPRDLETICLKAMAKEPGRRYAEAGDLARDLRRYLRGEPIQARPVARVERLARWCRRKPAVAGMIATAAALLTVVVVGTTYTAVREREVAKQQRESAENERTLRGDVEGALQSSTLRLAHHYAANGARLMNEDDASGSLVWNAEALKLVAGDPDREYPHRIRLQSALQECPPLRQFWLHDSPVEYADFIPSSRLVMTAAGNSVHLWNIDTGAAAAPPMEHPDSIAQATCSLDGRWIATVASDGAARLWNALTGERVGDDFRLDTGNALCVALSADGKFLAAGGDGEIVRVWHTDTGVALVSPPGGSGVVTQVLFSPDGSRLLWATMNHDDGCVVRVWEHSSGQKVVVSRPEAGYGWVQAAWSHAGDRFISFNRIDFSGAWVCQVEDGRALTGPFGGANISSAQFSPDDGVIATADARLFHAAVSHGGYLWRAKDTGRIAGPLSHRGRINSIEFSPDGAYVTTASDDRTARVWDAGTGQPVGPPLYHALAVRGSKFGDEGRLLLTFSGDKTARLWDLAAGGDRAPSAVAGDSGGREARSPNGKLLALEGRYEEITIYNLAIGDAVCSIPRPHEGDIEAIEFSPDSRRLLTISEDKTAKLWDVATGAAAAPPMRHSQGVFAARFSHDGRLLATHAAGWRPAAQSGHHAGEVRVWNVQTGAEALPAIATPYTVYDLEFSRDDRLLAACSRDSVPGKSEIIVCEIGGAKVVRRLSRDQMLSVVELSPDGRLLAAASGHDSSGVRDDALVFDLATGEVVASLPHAGSVESVQFSLDGRHLVTASADGEATVWRTDTWQRAAPTIPHASTGDVWAAFSDDGRGIVTADWRLWDISTATPMTRSLLDSSRILVIAPDGDTATGIPFYRPAAAWNQTPQARSVEEWTRLGQLVSGRRLDATGSLLPLEPAEVMQLWERDGRHELPDVQSSESDLRRWHERQGITHLAARKWWSADWHFQRLARDEPRPAIIKLAAATAEMHLGRNAAIINLLSDHLKSHPDRDLLISRAEALVAEKKWRQAAADFILAADTAADAKDEAESLYKAALCYLEHQDLASFRAVCEEALERLGDTEDFSVAARLVYTIAPAPHAVTDRERVVRLARLAASKSAYQARLVGAALFRADQFDQVESEFEMARDEYPARGWDYYFLAMTCRRLGQLGQAGDYLGKASEWWRVNYDKVPWTERIEMHQLRQEAERLIQPPDSD